MLEEPVLGFSHMALLWERVFACEYKIAKLFVDERNDYLH